MSGLLFLTPDDFNIQRGPKGPVLGNKIRNFSLVMFYSVRCPKCKDLIPVFKRLPGSIGGCQFGICNIDTDRRIIGMSKMTIGPIRYVPYILLFLDGKPITQYDPNKQYTKESIQQFIISVAEHLQKKQKLSTLKNIHTRPNALPTYSLGKPVVGDDDVCYLEAIDAYDPNHEKKQKSKHETYASGGVQPQQPPPQQQMRPPPQQQPPRQMMMPPQQQGGIQTNPYHRSQPPPYAPPQRQQPPGPPSQYQQQPPPGMQNYMTKDGLMDFQHMGFRG